MNNETRSTIVTYLEGMMMAGSIKPEAVPALTRFLDEVLDGVNDEAVRALTEKIKDWEDTMGDDDKSLYTLGIRQAVDVLRGNVPTHAKEYRPLGEEDFRPKEETKED